MKTISYRKVKNQLSLPNTTKRWSHWNCCLQTNANTIDITMKIPSCYQLYERLILRKMSKLIEKEIYLNEIKFRADLFSQKLKSKFFAWIYFCGWSDFNNFARINFRGWQNLYLKNLFFLVFNKQKKLNYLDMKILYIFPVYLQQILRL